MVRSGQGPEHMASFPRTLARLTARWLLRLLLTLALLLAGPAYMLAFGDLQFERSWRGMDRAAAGLAPDPREIPEAVVQVYAARAFNWRGVFAVHTWIAVKPEGGSAYTRYEVTRWRRVSTSTHGGAPDRAWFGNPPTLLTELRGASAAEAIPAIERAVAGYPFASRYQAWPGPNSNTFTAWIVRQVPALRVEFPPTAIGKDYWQTGMFARAPSGTGIQFALRGVIGVTLARTEGMELNVLGLVVGVDPLRPAVKIPGVGRIGMDGGGREGDPDPAIP